MTLVPVLWQLGLDVVMQVHGALPRAHLVPILVGCGVLACLGGVVLGRLAQSRLGAGLGALAGATLAAALTVTLFRDGYPLRDPDAGQCVLTSPVLLSGDGVANLLLFAPTALLAVLAVGRPRAVVLGVAAVSVAVECGQALRAVGICDSSDALLNTLGAFLAALAARSLRAAVSSTVRGSQPCHDWF